MAQVKCLNPFEIGKDGKREEVIAKYEAWLRAERQDLITAARRELRGKVLACWCAPQACHGDVLVKFSESNEWNT